MTINVNFITMGCAKNEVDTARMSQLITRAGMRVVEDVQDANVVVVNTCSFIEAATKESLDVIFDVAGLPACEQGRVKLVVAGCMPARYKSDLQDELTEAAAFVSCDEEDNIANVILGLFGGEPGIIDGEPCISSGDSCVEGGEPCADVGKDVAGGEKPRGAYTPTAGPYSTYVKISDGCNRFCSYCTIPYIRGRYRSFTFDDICLQVRAAQDAGVREVVLIAQDTGIWGSDLEAVGAKNRVTGSDGASNQGRTDAPLTLSWLLENLACKFPDIYFRVMYLQPEAITDALLDTMSAHDNIINYLDIPLQHVNPQILRDMNRAGSRQEFENLITRIKDKIPNITLRTTLIAGFPSESDEQFEELCDFCESGLFDYVGVFAYSREEGTRAYDLPNQIDEEEKQERAQRLSDIANTVCTSALQRKAGEEISVLIEGVNEEGNLYGRSLSQAPEVDGLTYVDKGMPGQIVKAKIVDSLFFDIEAEVVQEVVQENVQK